MAKWIDPKITNVDVSSFSAPIMVEDREYLPIIDKVSEDKYKYGISQDSFATILPGNEFTTDRDSFQAFDRDKIVERLYANSCTYASIDELIHTITELKSIGVSADDYFRMAAILRDYKIRKLSDIRDVHKRITKSPYKRLYLFRVLLRAAARFDRHAAGKFLMQIGDLENPPTAVSWNYEAYTEKI